MNIAKNALIINIFLFILFSCEIFMGKIPFLRYYDEILALFFLIVLFFQSIKKGFKISKYSKKILIFSILIALIGIVSNILFKQQNNKLAIVLDIVANFKIVVIGIGFSLLIKKENYKYIINFFGSLSKLFVVTGFIFGIISLFFDIGMRGQQRFGIWGFIFIFDYAHIYSTFLLIALLFINKKYNKNTLFYSILCFIQLILTTKGTSIVTVFILIILLVYSKKNLKIKLSSLIPISALSLLLGRYQIVTYFIKESPRKLFLQYGFITLKKFFPLGSGFATYGSDMAGKYYSSLYYSYGFQNYWGMNPYDNSFLNDNYWPMIVGQFGVFGLILSVMIVYYMCKIFLSRNLTKSIKPFVLVCLFYILLASIGTSIFTTSSTILLIITLIITTTDIKELCDNNS